MLHGQKIQKPKLHWTGLADMNILCRMLHLEVTAKIQTEHSFEPDPWALSGQLMSKLAISG